MQEMTAREFLRRDIEGDAGQLLEDILGVSNVSIMTE